ncbi:MAG: hypothetical protein AAFY47_06375 [Pseudomonadota bacterium]
MTRRVSPYSAALVSAVFALALGGCAMVQDALDYGRGPFDKSAVADNNDALEGLRESSWGNSGRWRDDAEASDADEALKEEAQDPDAPPMQSPAR